MKTKPALGNDFTAIASAFQGKELPHLQKSAVAVDMVELSQSVSPPPSDNLTAAISGLPVFQGENWDIDMWSDPNGPTDGQVHLQVVKVSPPNKFEFINALFQYREMPAKEQK